MFRAEQFKCLIPTPDAISEGVLHCSMNVTNATEVWSVVGSLATAVFTLGLLVAAIVAGVYAVRTYKEQLSDQKESLRRFGVDLQQRDNHAHQARVDEATMGMVTGIAKLVEASQISQSEVLRVSSDLRAKTVQYNFVWEFSAKERTRIDIFVTGLVLLARAASQEDLVVEGALLELDRGYAEFCDWVSELTRGELDMDDFTNHLVDYGHNIRKNYDRWFRIADARFRGEETVLEYDDSGSA